MKIEPTTIEGLFLVRGCCFHDSRGSLIKPYSESFFEGHSPVNLNFKETWFTRSKKGVIRAMHLQVGEHSCEKMISVIQGGVLDVVLDLRKGSQTFGKWFEIELTEDNPVSLYIPVGCSHGYKSLKDSSIVMYMATEPHLPKEDVGIRWDSFGYDWKIEDPIVSERDKELPTFESYMKDTI
jgi:dTDP-4-dehydrorhamnose 3,5-epimerase